MSIAGWAMVSRSMGSGLGWDWRRGAVGIDGLCAPASEPAAAVCQRHQRLRLVAGAGGGAAAGMVVWGARPSEPAAAVCQRHQRLRLLAAAGGVAAAVAEMAARRQAAVGRDVRIVR